jgi:hypothetical protein
MSNGKLQEEYREIIKDDSVPMKTKVNLNAAMTADIYDIVREVKNGQDKFIEEMQNASAEQEKKLAVMETRQEANKEEIEKQRSRSDKNDVLSSVAVFVAAILTALGLKN